VSEIKEKLINKEKNYDLTKSDSDEKQLIGFMAECIGKLIEPDETLYLGNTFSFPCRQEGINDAYLFSGPKK
jgi:hexokinase